MTKYDLLDPRKNPDYVYDYQVSFYTNKRSYLYIRLKHLIIHTDGIAGNGMKISNQIELPLASLDFILATIARFKLPHDKGGLGGLNNSDSLVVEGEKILVDKIIHPHYGLEMYSITNFNRRSYIAQALNQEIEIFQETMDGGLLNALVEINKDYHDGVYG